MSRVAALLLAAALSAPHVTGAPEPPPPRPRGDVSADRILAQTENLRPEVLELALVAYRNADSEGYVKRPRLTVIDFELPSYEKRMWVIDMATGRVLHEEWVAHGMGSPRGSGGDMERAISFSNRSGTRKTSLGLYRTAETYQGKHGYSLRLDGLEPGINDAARDRTIVIHPAHYVTRDRAEERLVGRSWGCPAVRPKVARRLIDDIKGGSLLWTYYPDTSWVLRSGFLRHAQSEIAEMRAQSATTSAPREPSGR